MLDQTARSTSSGTGINWTITGDSPNWTSTSGLTIGYDGQARLNINNGATVNSVNATIGDRSGSSGTVNINDTGSNWTNTNRLTVGYDGHATLNIKNGATVISKYGSIGNYSGSSGIVNIQDTGSNWTITEDLRLGDKYDFNATRDNDLNATLTISTMALHSIHIAPLSSEIQKINLQDAESNLTTSYEIQITNGTLNISS